MQPIDQDSYATGFEDAFDYVTSILDMIVKRKTHLNPHVRQILNATIEVISS